MRQSGVRNGVQALMKKESDVCLYVHCFAHSLNLCVQEVTRRCELVRNCLEFISQLVQLKRFSPKRLNLFESIRKSVTLSESESGLSPSLRPLCPTRWTVRHSAINSILKNYHNLMSSLNIIQQGHDEDGTKGKGLLMQMESFDTFFSLKLAYLIFSAAEQFFCKPSSKDTTISEGIKGANLLKRHYTLMRTDESFSTFYQGILKESEGLIDEPVLPRCRRIPRRLDDGASPHCYTTSEDRYRHAYFEVLDQACEELENRFDQSDLTIIHDIMEALLVNAANGEAIREISADVIKCFRGKIDVSLLKVQLSMLAGAINTAFAGTSVKVKKVTNARTIADALNYSNLVKGMFSEIDKVLRLYFTFPVTSATAERSFSSLRLIKTYLRSTMTSQQFIPTVSP